MNLLDDINNLIKRTFSKTKREKCFLFNSHRKILWTLLINIIF